MRNSDDPLELRFRAVMDTLVPLLVRLPNMVAKLILPQRSDGWTREAVTVEGRRGGHAVFHLDIFKERCELLAVPAVATVASLAASTSAALLS